MIGTIIVIHRLSYREECHAFDNQVLDWTNSIINVCGRGCPHSNHDLEKTEWSGNK